MMVYLNILKRPILTFFLLGATILTSNIESIAQEEGVMEEEVQETEKSVVHRSTEKEDRAKEAGSGVLGSLGFGIKSGLAVSTFSDNQAHTGSKLGIVAGAFINYPLPFVDFIQLQVEALYLQQGGTTLDYENEEGVNNILENIFVSYQTTRRVTLHNIDVPVLLKIGMPFEVNSPVKPKLIIGPSFGFRMMATANYERTGELVSDPETVATTTGFEDVTSDYTKMQYGINMGVAGEFESEKLNFSIEARYRYGLSAATQGLSRDVIVSKVNDLNTHTLMVMFGIGLK